MISADSVLTSKVLRLVTPPPMVSAGALRTLISLVILGFGKCAICVSGFRDEKHRHGNPAAPNSTVPIFGNTRWERRWPASCCRNASRARRPRPPICLWGIACNIGGSFWITFPREFTEILNWPRKRTCGGRRRTPCPHVTHADIGFWAAKLVPGRQSVPLHPRPSWPLRPPRRRTGQPGLRPDAGPQHRLAG